MELIHQKDRNHLYRVVANERSFVLKWIEEPNNDVELRSYVILERLGVPTLPVYGRTEHAVQEHSESCGHPLRPTVGYLTCSPSQGSRGLFVRG